METPDIKKENILACLSSAPSNARIIRTAARMAQAFGGHFTALFVETPDFAVQTPEDKKRLIQNRNLAEQLGATVETVYGDDVPYQIAEFARFNGITKIVLGRSAATKKHFWGKPPITEQLLTYAPDIDIHIIPDINLDNNYIHRQADSHNPHQIAINIAKSVGILAGATVIGSVFYRWGFTNANIIMVYILGTLLISIATSHQVYSLASAVASVFVFNYFFTDPRFSLAAYETGYPVTFIVMFLTAYITGTFAQRYKEQARQSRQIAHRIKTLFDTDKLLSKAADKGQVIDAAANQIIKLLGRNIVILENTDNNLSAVHFFQPDNGTQQHYDFEKENPAAQRALASNHPCGATTDTFPNARYLYIALRVNDRVYGVVGIEAENNPLDAYAHSILLSIIGERALALENQKNAHDKEVAAVLAESEQLRANLLRSISHDLRTPLTTISGNASNLISNRDSFDAETRQQIYTDIYDDSIWLINLVENLLYATRIEEGRMTLNTSAQLLAEIIEDAIGHIGHKADGRHINFLNKDDMVLVKADARLVVQVVVNIIDNALKYTPQGTDVDISVHCNDGFATVSIADKGNGIPDADKDKVFDKFYIGTSKIADNRRSLGLGLYLCKAIIEAHGGKIYVTDNLPQGAVFSFTLPMENIPYYE